MPKKPKILALLLSLHAFSHSFSQLQIATGIVISPAKAWQGVLNVVEVGESAVCYFRAMTLSPLHLLVNWQIFMLIVINLCMCF